MSRGRAPVPPGFAVVGTGRCGTRYMSALLRAHGVNCGHEEWWRPDISTRTPRLDGDSSWLALPDIESGAWSGPVVHVVRDPVAVVKSLLGINFFGNRLRHADYVNVALRHEPELSDMEPAEAAVEWWRRWNRRCAAVADLTVRVEDLPARLPDVGRVIGRRLRPEAAGVGAGVNGRRRAVLGEAGVRDVWRAVGDDAAAFGYEVPALSRSSP